jgi:cytochrome c55X
LTSLCAATSLVLVAACSTSSPSPSRFADSHELHLVRMVRQDCGSCHGMRLTGGLGPPLTPAALANVPLDSVIATIYHGRPGTPMPGWKNMISEADARWIAEQLLNGFPTE